MVQKARHAEGQEKEVTVKGGAKLGHCGAERAPLLPGEHGRIKPMQRKRGGLVPIGEVFSDLSGPQSRRPVELADLLAQDYRETAAVSSGG